MSVHGRQRISKQEGEISLSEEGRVGEGFQTSYHFDPSRDA